MNDHQRAEEITADRLVLKAKDYGVTLAAIGAISDQDVPAAQIGVLLLAVHRLMLEQGRDLYRVLVRPE
jgi:hypothetical protein